MENVDRIPTLMCKSNRQRAARVLWLSFLALLCGCASAAPQNAELEAAVARFEAAAARAESAAALAEASAQQAADAAARTEPPMPSGPVPPYLKMHATEPYERCSRSGRGPVRTAAQASRIAQHFLKCLGLDWGNVAKVTYMQGGGHDFYRVDYNANAWEETPTVLVQAINGQAEFALPK